MFARVLSPVRRLEWRRWCCGKAIAFSLRIADDTLRANWRAPGHRYHLQLASIRAGTGQAATPATRRGGAGRLLRSFTAGQCFGWRNRRCVPCHNSHALIMAGIVRDRQVPVKVTAVVDPDADDLTRGLDETCGAQIQRRTGGD